MHAAYYGVHTMSWRRHPIEIVMCSVMAYAAAVLPFGGRQVHGVCVNDGIFFVRT